MPINASYEYTNAEKRYLAAQTIEEKILALEEMIKTAPGHKGGENLRANLKTRLVKLKEKQEHAKKKHGATKQGIKKESPQAVLIGLTQSGKSSIMSLLTNTSPHIDMYPFVTKEPLVGTLYYEGTRIQIIDLPSINSEYCDLGIVNSADTLLIIIAALEDIKEIEPFLTKAQGKRIIIFNKSDLLAEDEKRKLTAKLQTKKLNFLLFSAKTQENLQQFKKKILESFDIIRIYTKEPNKPPTTEPFIAKPGTTIAELAEKIHKGLSSKIKETKIWGPSSKFPGQKVGLAHILQDKDIIEFSTR